MKYFLTLITIFQIIQQVWCAQFLCDDGYKAYTLNPDCSGMHCDMNCEACPRGKTSSFFGIGETTIRAAGYVEINAELTVWRPAIFAQKGISPDADKRCVDCLRGWYQASEGAATCLVCPVGLFGPDLGRATACLQCARGFYQNNVGSSSCQTCQAGKYNAGWGMDMCTDCLPGRYNAIEGAAAEADCHACPAGFYQGLYGATSCNPCEVGKFSEIAAKTTTGCSECHRGQYQAETGQVACTSCPEGKFEDERGSNGCQECVQGKYSASIFEADCISCPVGKFWSNNDNKVECKPCEAGSSNALTGQTSCPLCAAGQYQDTAGSDSCKPCATGKYHTGLTGQNTDTSCSNCIIGQYSAETGQAACSSCAEGQYQDTAGSDSCKPCATGKYHNGFTGQTNEISCSSCDRGKYNALTGQISCSVCSGGKWQDTYGSAQCKDCDQGKYNGLSGQTNETSCFNCNVGQYSAETGQAACAVCPADSFQHQEGQALCFKCTNAYGPGYAPNANKTGCEICPPGEYANLETGLCTSCAPGKSTSSNYDVLTNRFIIDCAFCTAGKYAPGVGNAVCIDCPVGRYEITRRAIDYADYASHTSYELGQEDWMTELNGGRIDMEVTCRFCPGGTYMDELGASFRENNFDAYGQYVLCKNCVTGQYSNDGSGVCTDCPAGYLTNHQAETKNSIGWEQDIDYTQLERKTYRRFSDCTACRAGKSVPPGWAQSGTSKTCLNCQAGKFANLKFYDTFHDFEDGSRIAKSGGPCETCPNGKYKSGDWSNTGDIVPATCQQCPQGFYTDGFPNPECKQQASCGQDDNGGQRQVLYGPGLTTQNSSDVTCSSCGKGEAHAGYTCPPCSAGKYQDMEDHASSCKTCFGLGNQTHIMVSDIGAHTCRPVSCETGYVPQTILVNGEDSRLCVLCPPGSVTQDKDNNPMGNNPGAAKCSLCPEGTWSASSTEPCTGCPPNSHLHGANCKCNPGFYKSGFIGKYCTECNKISNALTVTCDIDNPTQSTVLTCNAKSRKIGNSCVECPLGQELTNDKKHCTALAKKNCGDMSLLYQKHCLTNQTMPSEQCPPEPNAQTLPPVFGEGTYQNYAGTCEQLRDFYDTTCHGEKHNVQSDCSMTECGTSSYGDLKCYNRLLTVGETVSMHPDCCLETDDDIVTASYNAPTPECEALREDYSRYDYHSDMCDRCPYGYWGNNNARPLTWVKHKCTWEHETCCLAEQHRVRFNENPAEVGAWGDISVDNPLCDSINQDWPLYPMKESGFFTQRETSRYTRCNCENGTPSGVPNRCASCNEGYSGRCCTKMCDAFHWGDGVVPSAGLSGLNMVTNLRSHQFISRGFPHDYITWEHPPQHIHPQTVDGCGDYCGWYHDTTIFYVNFLDRFGCYCSSVTATLALDPRKFDFIFTSESDVFLTDMEHNVLADIVPTQEMLEAWEKGQGTYQSLPGRCSNPQVIDAGAACLVECAAGWSNTQTNVGPVICSDTSQLENVPHCVPNICTCPHGTATVYNGYGGTVCDVVGVDCSACDTGYFLSDTAAAAGSQTCIKLLT